MVSFAEMHEDMVSPEFIESFGDAFQDAVDAIKDTTACYRVNFPSFPTNGTLV
jgi:hypothetical protein